MRFKPLLPVLILGGVLFALVFTARYTQRKMYEHETRTGAAATPTDSANPETPVADPNTVPDELVERQRLSELFPDTLINVWGIRFKILREGSGPKPVSGNRITAHYRARLLDGTEFDSSYSRDQPYAFTLMAPGVIRGWHESFIDMRKGEQRLIVVPYKYAYGSAGRPPTIPPRAPLVFEVELVDFQ